MTFGETLRKAREQLTLSQETAAKAIEAKYKVRLSAAYLSMIENDVKTNLTVKLINALLDFFNLPLNAAASLFTPAFQLPGYSGEQTVRSVRETPAYPEDLNLPEEAQLALKEFHDFLQCKYNGSKKTCVLTKR